MAKKMKKIILFGSTGSVGMNALEIVRAHPDNFKIVALAAGSNHQLLLEQVAEFKPEAVALADEQAASELHGKLPSGTQLFSGAEGLKELAGWSSGDLMIAASSGSSALVPVLEAIGCKKDIAIANKEILVMAGRIILEASRQAEVRILPVDSEHNAIFQCLEGASGAHQIRRILLTGSGGPLKDIPFEKFKGLTKEFVVKHPKWTMGKKISVDSATMMNKGLEIIEAHWLFGVEPSQIDVLIHPEAIVHSMVEFVDGSIIAQMGPTDMKLPLIHAMSYPERTVHPELKVGLADMAELHFLKPDLRKFPCLGYALEVARRSDTTLPAVLSAADEMAVDAFLKDKIDFIEIPVIIEKLLKNHSVVEAPALADILEADRWTREEAQSLCETVVLK